MLNEAPSSYLLPYHLFDSCAALQITERRLPHWSQPGAVAFITWRLHDSMPNEVLKQWFNERRQMLASRGIDPDHPEWQEHLSRLDSKTRHNILHILQTRWHDSLDSGLGTCVLRTPALSKIVADSLQHFDGQRYILIDFVVMPNHVHLLAAFPDEDGMLAQCKSWKHFTATQINKNLGRSNRLWQQDAFDHLVRSEGQLGYFREYIKTNPEKARLQSGEYVHFSKKAI
jgi:type I restriction enzyme R subunit